MQYSSSCCQVLLGFTDTTGLVTGFGSWFWFDWKYPCEMLSVSLGVFAAMISTSISFQVPVCLGQSVPFPHREHVTVTGTAASLCLSEADWLLLSLCSIAPIQTCPGHAALAALPLPSHSPGTCLPQESGSRIPAQSPQAPHSRGAVSRRRWLWLLSSSWQVSEHINQDRLPSAASTGMLLGLESSLVLVLSADLGGLFALVPC